ncbi:MAG: histone-like nucleoid-structuring protein Lsr2, partial [Angustibacter sp.]
MAKREITILTDDLDGKESEDIETVTFGFEGASYEIDLSKKNRDAMAKALTPYLDVARRAGSSTRRLGGAKTKTDKEQLKAIREWARANGHEVSDRGRI